MGIKRKLCVRQRTTSETSVGCNLLPMCPEPALCDQEDTEMDSWHCKKELTDIFLRPTFV